MGKTVKPDSYFKTWFDLDANKVVMDYDELLKVALIAERHALWNLERELKEWHDYTTKGVVSTVTAKYMRDYAEDLARATNAVYYLSKGSDREEIGVHREPEAANVEDSQGKKEIA